MALGRDWLHTLQRLSYKGAPFWAETYQEGGARRVVIHEFPMRDAPYLEDLGERYREFTITAYVASDRADSEAAALMNMCATRGPGVVVLPDQGPVTVRCTEFARVFEKDRLGYIAHDLKFVREGFGSALASASNLINRVFIQAEAVASVVAAAYATAALIRSVPDYVSDALRFGTENALATLEAVRTSIDVEPVASAAQRDAIEAAYAAIPDALEAEAPEALVPIAASVVTVASALVENATATVAASAMVDVLDATPVVVPASTGRSSAWIKTADANTQTANTLLRLAALTAYCEAIVRMTLADRPTAVTLRANVATYFEEQLGALRSEDYDLFHALTKLRDATVDYLSRAIIDLAPVVKVNANLSMPSLYWSWRLYADPTHASDLADRNRVPHPSFMPNAFEALKR